jgi:cytochrome c peroxidase
MKTGSALRLILPAWLAALTGCSDAPQQITESEQETQFATVSDMVALGQNLFQDQNLSLKKNQSCQTCHEPSEGFAASLATVVTQGSVVQGSIAGKFGNRKPPSAAYAAFVPIFSASGSGGTGGNFWDGRATGRVLGNPAADQALGPFLNPAEQALPDAACVVLRVRNSNYINTYTSAWGADILSIAFPANSETVCGTAVAEAGAYVALSAADRAKATSAYNNIALSIAAFEKSSAVSKFNSRFDQGNLTALEREGAKLFNGKGKCHQCHPSNSTPALFSDFKYHNIGAPLNPDNPVFNYTTKVFDTGLGSVTGRSAHIGKFRTPTVRNTALGTNRTYLHNGVLTSVKQVVDFYNTRDALPVCTAAQVAALVPAQYGSFDPDGAGPLVAGKCWPEPEISVNLDTKQMGNLGLSEAQVNAIVAFVKTLNDQ